MHAALQSPNQMSPRDQASAAKNSARNQSSATSMPYSQVVKAVGVVRGEKPLCEYSENLLMAGLHPHLFPTARGMMKDESRELWPGCSRSTVFGSQ